MDGVYMILPTSYLKFVKLGKPPPKMCKIFVIIILKIFGFVCTDTKLLSTCRKRADGLCIN